MASNSKILREERLRELELSCREKRRKLRNKKRYGTTPQERFDAMIELDAMGANSSPVRQRRRCSNCAKPRGIRLTGLCSQHTKDLIGEGLLPGLVQGRRQ